MTVPQDAVEKLLTAIRGNDGHWTDCPRTTEDECHRTNCLHPHLLALIWAAFEEQREAYARQAETFPGTDSSSAERRVAYGIADAIRARKDGTR
jgi:hypothetical protein